MEQLEERREVKEALAQARIAWTRASYALEEVERAVAEVKEALADVDGTSEWAFNAFVEASRQKGKEGQGDA